VTRDPNADIKIIAILYHPFRKLAGESPEYGCYDLFYMRKPHLMLRFQHYFSHLHASVGTDPAYSSNELIE
jgi:hypothetical protein